MLARGLFGLVFGGVLPLLFAATPAPNDPVMSKQLTSDLPALIKRAELIIDGKVDGLVDPEPAARLRREREAHRVLTRLTFRGYDETGRVLVVNPRGLSFDQGQSYILFLGKIEGNFWEAQGARLVSANEQNIRLTKDEVARQGVGVLPARVVWMTHSGGWQKAPLAEFFVNGSGHFEWKTRAPDARNDPAESTLFTGMLPESALQNLLHKIETARAGPMADDAGIVSFNWVQGTAEVMTKTYYAPGASPCAELLESIAELARTHASPRSPP